MASLFFYGTLMHPSILGRVLDRKIDDLKITPATLENHTRHRVLGADYPATITLDMARELFASEYGPEKFVEDLSSDERSVRGTHVKGLTSKDVKNLDVFEGHEYERRLVKARLLPLTEKDATAPSSEGPQPNLDELPLADCQTYIWIAPVKLLSPELWSYDSFLREAAHRWVGETIESDVEEEYAIVDAARNKSDKLQAAAVDAAITQTEQQNQNGHQDDEQPKFGHAFKRRYFAMPPDFIPLNHGSYGAVPLPVLAHHRKVQLEIESAPDRWYRETAGARIVESRRRLAELINADVGEVFLTPNISSFINSIFLTLEIPPNSSILYFPHLSYPSNNQLLQLLSSRWKFPLIAAPASIINGADLATFLDSPACSPKPYIALFECPSSMPTHVPDSLGFCKALRQRGIKVVWDGAHSVGHIDLDFKKWKAEGCYPDFFVSACHKWLFTPRTVCVGWVPRENQKLIRSLPVAEVTDDMETPLVEQWAYPATVDFAAFASVPAAIDFRRDRCGGEDNIRSYCRDLITKGCAKLIEILGTEGVVPGNIQLATVRLPLPAGTKSEQGAMRQKLQQAMWERDFFIQVLVDKDSWWVRASAQIYNELSDFETAGRELLKLCEENGGGREASTNQS